DPSKQYGLEAVAKTKGQYNLKSAQLDLETLLLDVKIEDFRETIRGLRNTQMAIPAPINDLRGKISLLVGSEKLEKMRDGKFNIPIQFKTDLTAAKQSLVTEAKGAAIIQPTPFEGSIDVDFNLNDVAIRLPDFDPISKFPTVVGDSRFVTKEERVSRKEVFKEEKKEPSNFKMNISIDTPQKPIRILYHLFKPAAVFRVKTKIRERGTDFNVNFEPFDVSYLKRTAHLERLKITNDDEAESIALNGRFSIKKSDYTIYVDIEQVAKKSYVTLSSEPPLSEDDIVSLILFNELASELDSTSNDSVQDTQAAMTKKTIGFLSFFALASTPIESVNYDPTTQQYSARVKLPGGFTGTVGSDWENSQQVGIRRRLGGKFVISAGVGTDTEGGQRQETMLEWYHRY
ncbi:MAG: translocation/assembly module TamB domain-containing protein, partial [Proteobacteria bacterium]|nr:translocation/assembly module TamB domain-containing protein [Pseudomonadota bacterium]